MKDWEIILDKVAKIEQLQEDLAILRHEVESELNPHRLPLRIDWDKLRKMLKERERY